MRNAVSNVATLGARHLAKEARAELDFYTTDPKAVKMLLDLEKFERPIFEPACGEGHISKVFEAAGYKVISNDIVRRGYAGQKLVEDFLKSNYENLDMDIVTNPPFEYCKEFAEKALESVREGCKVILFLKIQFLETKKRGEFFKKYPPKRIYVTRSRLSCALNGDKNLLKNANAMCFCWFVWEKGFIGNPEIFWFN